MRPTLLFKKNRARKTRPKQKPGYRAEAKAEFKRAYERLFGSQGGASPEALEIAAGTAKICVSFTLGSHRLV